MKTRNYCRTVVCILFSAVAAHSKAAPMVELAPLTPWDMHYADDSCRLFRLFGAKDNPVTLIFESYQPGDMLSISVLGKQFETTRQNIVVKAGFGPGFVLQSRVATAGIAKTTGNERKAMLLLGHWVILRQLNLLQVQPYPPVQTAFAKTVTTFQIEATGSVTQLKLGPMDKPFAAIEDCARSLVNAWGLDAEKVAKYRRQATPIGSPAKWVTNIDYPEGLLRNGTIGFVHARISIDSTGKPTDCVIQQQTKPVGFATSTCRLLKERARFDPALDEAGQPAPGYYVTEVRYSIPG